MTTQRWLDVGDETLTVDIHEPCAHGSGQGLDALVLHGAGEAGQQRTRGAQQALLQTGLRCVSFDFSGCGQSSVRSAGSLNKRTREAEAVLTSFSRARAIVVAFSMSGQCALELVARRRASLAGLILCSPAIYADHALDLPFGTAFSTCIREPRSWRSATVHEALRLFPGRVVLVRPAHDEVIPDDVFEMIESACRPGSLLRIVLPDASHALGAWFNEHPQEARLLFAKAVEFVAAGGIP